MSLSADRLTPWREVNRVNLGIKAATLVYAGAMAFNDAGVARGGVPTATTPVLGVADSRYDNSGGGAGAIRGDFTRGKAFPFVNGTSGDLLAAADIMASVYAVDDTTVGKTSATNTRPIAGTLVDIDAQGMCWVKIG